MRDEILKTLPAPERETVLKLANEFELRDDDPAWLFAALAGNWKSWMERETTDAAQAHESAVQHIRAQHKTTIEQLQSATAAASSAAKLELAKAAKTAAEDVADAAAKSADTAIRELAKSGAQQIKWAWLVPPIVTTCALALIVGLGAWGAYKFTARQFTELDQQIKDAKFSLAELNRLSGGIEISTCSGKPCVRVDKALTRKLGTHGNDGDFFFLKLKNTECQQ